MPRTFHALPLTALLALATIAHAAATTQSADLSDPRKTVESFLHAVESTNPAAIRNAIVAAPDQQATVTTIINLWVAQAKLREAAEAKFPDQGVQYFGTVSSQIDARLKTLETAPLKITGDSAILDVPADAADHRPAGSVTLKKIDNAWKLDAASLFNLSTASPETTARRIALAAKLTAISDAMTQDINANKFPSAGDAYQEFWNRSLAVMKPTPPATTAPATQPH